MVIEKIDVPTPVHPLDVFLRIDRVPTLWCPGCGLGILLGCLLRAISRRVKEGALDPNKVVFSTGIGCSARTTFYVDFDGAHTLHGRAIAFATGAKLANPDLELIVIGGDGDIAGIGGNHLVHAARRNMDMLVVMNTNFIYAMTGGQLAPTTPFGVATTTTPYGNPEKPLDVIKMLSVFEINYLARGSVTHPHVLENYFYKAMGMKGFRFIEVVSTCPEIFGRHIGIRDAVELFMELKKKIVFKPKPEVKESMIDWYKGIIIGEFMINSYEGYVDLMKKRYIKPVGV